jgi:acetyl-CoA C-acetyltransferase
MTCDDHLPIAVGVGSISQRLQNPKDAHEPLDLMIRAARKAESDSGVPGLLSSVEYVAVPTGRWCYEDPGRAIAYACKMINPTTVKASVGVLQQSLISDACRAIQAGKVDTALVVGGDTGHRIKQAASLQISLKEFDAPGRPDIVLAPAQELRHPAEKRAGLTMPVGLYAMLESALRSARKQSISEHREMLARLYARFSDIAQQNPDAWMREKVSVEELTTGSARNRLQSSPYTTFHCSNWSVDQAGALIFCSLGKAKRLGIDIGRCIFPLTSAESNYMAPVTARSDLARCKGAQIVGAAALQNANLTIEDIDYFDLYSCFPAAVQLFAEELAIPASKDLTVTGGMPFAGGPYNNYVLQSTIRLIEILRKGEGKYGLVSAVSGILTKQAIAVWSCAPSRNGFVAQDCTDEVQKNSIERKVIEQTEGQGRVVGYTVLHQRAMKPRCIVLAETPTEDRTICVTEDPTIIGQAEKEDLVGRHITAHLDGGFILN